MPIYHRVLACGIALWLAFAGTVALSPVLHHWIEHGGHGQLHLHGKFSLGHTEAGANKPKVFGHERPFDLPLPKIDLAPLFHALLHVLGDSREQSSDSAGHEHHSLSQLLASGLVEHTIDAPLFEVIFFVSIRGIALAEDPLLDSSWDAQTATRGPPLERS